MRLDEFSENIVEKSCPFCTSSQYAERLVGSIGSFNVIATFGQISEGGYLLLVSKEHIPCLGEMQDMRELEQAIAHLQNALSKEYATSKVTIFEHGIVGQTVFHAHLHLIPEIVDIGERVKKDFPHYKIKEFTDFHAFHSVYTLLQMPYLLWGELGGKIFVCWDPPAVPQYLRIVVADALGKPERANWRTMDAALDRRLCLETVARLKPHISQGS